MPAVTIPAQRCVAAAIARLSNTGNGFNPSLVACVAGTGLPAFAIDFAKDSQNFLRGKYNIEQLFEDTEITLPAIAIYQGPSKSLSARERLVGTVFSGSVVLGIDLHLMSGEGQSQTDFDALVTCSHDAMVNTFNAIGANDYATRQLVWDGDISMGQPTRILDEETGQYLSTLPFRLVFNAPV